MLLGTPLLGLILLSHLGEEPAVTVPAIKHPGPNAAAVAIAPDGSLVAAGYGGPSTGRFPLAGTTGGIVVWDRKTGQRLFEIKEFGSILRVEFSQDSRFVAYTRIYTPGDSLHSPKTVLMESKTGRVVHEWSVDSFAFSPTRNHLLIGTRDRVEVVAVPSLEVLQKISIRGPRSMVISADGQTAAALGTFWQGNRGSSDGLYLFRLDGKAKEADLIRNGENLHKAQSLTLSPNGEQVVTGHDGGEARVWSTREADAPPRLLTLDTPLALFPLFLDQGKTLGLITQPANGASWNYDRNAPSGFQVAKGQAPPWADLYRYDLSTDPPKRVHWRFEDAAYRTYYARFRTTRGTPEVNSRRYVLSADGTRLLVGCNGCTLIDAATGKIERRFVRED